MAVHELENAWIPLSDGTDLAARIWLPEGAEEQPVPAVLEYLPYGKNGFTAHEDALRHPYFAAHGYAAVRVDLRGTGESDGLLMGEYLKQEHDDCLEVLEWLEQQPWCTGDVGMIGYSWGGFNGLQMAALAPPQLGAIITVASTDDRYLDDCHYQGGAMLASDMLKWAASMLTYPIQPPDQRFVGERWREMWMHRLENAPELALDWSAHQRRDEFWKHGSVAEKYDAIKCPVFAVGGWADAYTNAIPRLLENLTAPSLGLIGPWAHMFPHTGTPGPAIGFLQEAVRWWDQWLKGEDTGIMDEPRLRAWMQEYVTPARSYAERPGRWIGTEWPALEAEELALELGSAVDDGSPLLRQSSRDTDAEDARSADWLTLSSPQHCGEATGVWCVNGLGDEMAIDQRSDDELSLTFTTDPLESPVEVLGRPRVELRLRSDKPHAFVAARLEDVAPSGESLLVCWDMLNLSHRDSHESPSALEPGREYDISFELGVCGHVFAPGHRMRIALSSTYWPHAWPAPEEATLHIAAGGPSRVVLPLLSADGGEAPVFEPPEMPEPLAVGPGDGAGRVREISTDPESRRHAMVDRQHAVRTMPGSGVQYSEVGTDAYWITEGDPDSGLVRAERRTSSIGPDGDWSVEVVAEMSCCEGEYRITETYSAHEGDVSIFNGTREYTIPRDYS